MKTIEKHSLLAFCILVFGMTWGLWIPATITKLNGGISIWGPDSPVGQFGRWSPGIAAILLTAILVRKPGLKRLLRSLGIWRVHIGWYAIVIFIQPAILFLSRWLDNMLGNPERLGSPLDSISYPLAFVIPFMVLSAFPGSVAEELGWRGFALPRLQNKMNALTASVILALVWAIWHIPTQVFSGQARIFEISIGVLNFIPVTILYTWIYINTKSSLLLVTLLHVTQQLVAAFWGIPSITGDMLMWLAAIALVLRYGTQLSKETIELTPTYG